MTIRAASYARYSTDKQTETTIKDQQRACREWAAANDCHLLYELADEAVSGAAFGNRPGAQELQRLAFARAVDLIVVLDLTRLSRSTAGLTTFLEQAKFRGVRVVGVQGGFDSTNRTARMQAGMSGIMSDEFRAAVGERTHLALNALAKGGKPTGSRAYGYTSTHEIIPQRAAIVREIFKRVAAGDSMKAVVNGLNARGVPSPGADWKRSGAARQGGKWIISSLHAMLKNEMYAGRLIWNRSQWIKDPDTGIRQARPRPRSEWVIEDKPGLRIIDAETFEAVQTLFAGRKDSRHGGGPRGGLSKYPLSGILICGLCGSRFVMSGGGANSRGYGKKGARYYVCSTFHMGGIHACANNLRADREFAEAALVKPAIDQLLSPAAVKRAVDSIKKQIKEKPPAPVIDLSALEARQAKIRALVLSGALDEDEAALLFAKIEGERLTLLRAAQRAVQAPLISGAWGVEAEYRAVATQMRDDLQSDQVITVRAALRTLYGPTIKLMPEGQKLIAELNLQEDSILAASGGSAGGRIWIGSGGALCIHIPL